jgi:signal transduction histidine kinase
MVMNMNRNSIRWRLPASYGVIALLAALALGSVMLLVLRSYYARQEREYLFGNAVTLKPILEQVLQSNLPEGALQDQINGLAFLSQAQIRLLDNNQNPIADSGVPDQNQFVAVAGAPAWNLPFFSSSVAPATEERRKFIIYSNVEVDSEVRPFDGEPPDAGFAQQMDVILPVSASPYGYAFVRASRQDSTRRSSQVAKVPLIGAQGERLGELEFSNGPSYGADVIDSVTNAWLVASVFAVVVAAFAGWFMSKRVTRPVLALEQATRQMEQGNLRARVNMKDERQQEFLSLANSFNGMAAQVEQTVSTLREFVADAAHELHTPLTALQANIELARNEKDAASRARYLSRAHEQSQRLEALVQSLLDLSRIEAAEFQLTLEPVNLVQLGREIGEQFASRAEQADRLFSMEISKDELPVLGNETQMSQVILNLLENALKFTPQNGSISLTLEQVDDEARLTIRDTGIGIPPEDLPHLFERFHRGRNASEYAGNGLGLAIVKAIVTRHGGNVTIESQPGQGTQVRVSIPVASEH